MEVWLLVIGIVTLYLGYPYARCFFKRLSLRSKVMKKCREKGYFLQGTHAFWFLGGKYGKKCDVYIETEKELLAIKLFGMPRRRRVLFFTENNYFFIRRFFGHMSMTGGFAFSLIEKVDSKEELIPEYDFDCKCKPVAEGKPLRKMLLVNPVPEAIHMKEKKGTDYVMNLGDMVSGMELMNLSGFLIML